MKTRFRTVRGRVVTLAVAVVAMVVATAGCIDRGDAMGPMVSITEPRSGATSKSEGLTIKGYALDDDGVAAIRVNGSDLLSNAIYDGERGKRLIEFAFTMPPLNDGDMMITIEVEDVGGRVTTLPYRLQLDNTRPTLELAAVTPLSGGMLRVEGTVRDNTLVTSVRINDVPLQFTPAPEFSFRVDVADAEGGEIVVEDAAGNVTRGALR